MPARFDALGLCSYLGGMTHTRAPRLLHLLAALALGLTASAALAQDSPAERPDLFAPDARQTPGGKPEGPAAEVPDDAAARAKLLDSLFDRLSKVSSAEVAIPIRAAIDKLSSLSGSDTADLLLSRSIEASEQGRKDIARKLLDSALELQPDFAEAWSRRAYLNFQDNDTGRALGDIRRALALDPRHLKSLEGLGGILRQIGEKKPALEAYRKLKTLNPFTDGIDQAIKELETEVEGQGI